jgi:hypothetical protein
MRSGLSRAPRWASADVCPSIVAALVLAFAIREERGASAQQQADSSFVPHVVHPAFRQRGPRVLIDEAHNNFHTAGGRYAPFAALLTADGFRVAPSTRRFERSALPAHAILVIANAMGGDSVAAAYDHPAFSEAECDAVAAWVRAGGALLLIADHAPFGTGAASLGSRFGVGMGRGYTEDPVHHAESASSSTLVFSRDNGLLRRHPIIDGRNASELVNLVVAYTGQSLTAPPGAKVLLALGAAAFDHPSPTAAEAASEAEPGMAWMSAVAGLPTRPAGGRAMAVALRFGRGRVVVFGEAAMFTAQTVTETAGTRKMGMSVNNDNEKLALNVVRWLAGLLPVQ